MNLAVPEQIDSFVNQVTQVDVLINNAAAVLLEDWTEPGINIKQLRETFEVIVN
ncbi:hypothetical protein [Legionella yabuuchiae]|uniref:hypothetical protein n=1 Tax=Legionella yabuuchiae TaxID=376727 RepID=UPI0013EF8296|nr:hypothetical protein [Legionella yabuuchiae]